jgi:hypothetical protein
MRNNVFMILFLVYHSVDGQERRGFESYYYPGNPGVLPALSSKLFCQTSNGWYTEIRYNYEEAQTVACSAGKTFAKENVFSYSLTPAAGVIGGKSQGASIGLNASAVYKKISFSSTVEQAVCFGKEAGNFLFSWSELGCQVTKHLYAGLALQQTCWYHAAGSGEPGLECSISFAGWTFPFYLFRQADKHCYFLTGICYEWKK